MLESFGDVDADNKARLDEANNLNQEILKARDRQKEQDELIEELKRNSDQLTKTNKKC